MFATFIELYKERYSPHFYSCDCIPGVYRDPEEAEKPINVLNEKHGTTLSIIVISENS